MRPSNPLISCICITSNRPVLLQKAIACFESQNYINKELVISYPKDDLATKELLQQYGANEAINILAIERDPKDTLGAARNHALYKCHGDYICTWDDDDWHHSSRLSFQFNSLHTVGPGFQASVLRRVFLYDYTTKLAYLSSRYHWDGTLFCRKEVLLQNQYGEHHKSEDTHVLTFLDNRKMLAHIDESPFLYIYTYHGSNTWPYDHFEIFMQKGHLLNEEFTNKVRGYLGD
jgi:glycosyltransferase involved in cell wall biosynthesis